MKTLLPILAVALLLAIAAATLARRQRPTNDRLKPRRPLTDREQAMFWRLNEAFPQHVVLAQVSFSALLTCRRRATRNTFDRKTADFVLCDRAFTPLAVIELDDASHEGKKEQDANRDAMLQRAGYQTIRFKQLPDIEAAQLAVRSTPTPPTGSHQ